jgi:replicative DNA helicase
LKKVEDIGVIDAPYIQETSMLFCKRQELRKATLEIEKIIESGELTDFSKCEEILKKALEYGLHQNEDVTLTDIVDILADDYRTPIPTGILGLDIIMDGGLGRGELGIVLAPFGTGKTSFLTKVANTAKDLGYNVLQIFFEDMPKAIWRKHLACWSGHELNSFKDHKEELTALAELKNAAPGILKLKKFPSDSTTMPIIKQYIKKCISDGFKPDIVILDYIDVVQSSTNESDNNVAEGKIMRQYEAMASEFNFVAWTAVQSNREGVNAEVVDGKKMGGSIKKAQIGHFIVSIAKTLDQMDEALANIAIIKSRFGKSGTIFENVKFDNSRIQIEITSNIKPKTNREMGESKDKNNISRVTQLLQESKMKNFLANLQPTQKEDGEDTN